MTSSRITAAQKALEFIARDRKRFYRELYKRWADRGIMSGSLNGKWEFKENPELYAEAQIVLKSLVFMGFTKEWQHGIGNSDAIEVLKVHREKFIKLRLIPMVKKNRGKFPEMPKTLAITEFIARGFVHESEYQWDRNNKYGVKCNIAPLVWPGEFDQHQDAIEIQNKMGIPGYTGTTLPNRK